MVNPRVYRVHIFSAFWFIGIVGILEIIEGIREIGLASYLWSLYWSLSTINIFMLIFPRVLLFNKYYYKRGSFGTGLPQINPNRNQNCSCQGFLSESCFANPGSPEPGKRISCGLYQPCHSCSFLIHILFRLDGLLLPANCFFISYKRFNRCMDT